MIHHTTQLPLDVIAPARARAALGEALTSPITNDVFETARLLITELLTNSVRHGATSPGSTVRIEIDTNAERLKVEVHDAGVGTTHLRPAEEFGGVYGLQLVDQLADRWGSDHGGDGNCVWFELMLAPTSSV